MTEIKDQGAGGGEETSRDSRTPAVTSFAGQTLSRMKSDLINQLLDSKTATGKIFARSNRQKVKKVIGF